MPQTRACSARGAADLSDDDDVDGSGSWEHGNEAVGGCAVDHGNMRTRQWVGVHDGRLQDTYPTAKATEAVPHAPLQTSSQE